MRNLITVVLLICVVFSYACEPRDGSPAAIEKAAADADAAEEKYKASTFMTAIASLRSAAAQSALAELATEEETGILKQEYYDILQESLSELGYDWFARSTGAFYADTNDTANRNITYITDGTWVATFYVPVQNDGNKRPSNLAEVLLDYTFVQDDISGFRIEIVD